VLRAVRRYAETGYGDVRRLAGSDPPEYRLRVGDWRVRLSLNEAPPTLDVLRVRHRSAVYGD